MIVYQQEDGSVAVCSLVSSVPTGAQYIETTNVPEDRFFRSAWELGTDSITTNLTKAKEIVHGRRRDKRMEEFEPHDDIIKLQVPGQDIAKAEAARATIRGADSARQTAIDACADEAALRQVIIDEAL